MVWGAISRKGKLNILFVEGTLNGEKYIELLKKTFPELANKLYGENKWRF